MSLVIYKLLAAVLIALMSIVTVIYPLRATHKIKPITSFELGEALASGIFLGAAFLHMLPNAIHGFRQLYGHIEYPVPELVCVAGFLLMLLLERLSLLNALRQSHQTIPYILTLILLIHSLTEGAALGIGSTFTESLMIFIAIIAHKGSASFALCMTLMRYHLSTARIIFIIAIFSLMTPLGIALGTLITMLMHSTGGALTAVLFNAFAAGTFIYISTLHHVQFHQRIEKAQAIAEFGYLTLGLVAMAIIAIWA